MWVCVCERERERERERDWVTMLYNRNWHNIVNQVSFNKTNQKKKKEEEEEAIQSEREPRANHPGQSLTCTLRKMRRLCTMHLEHRNETV